MNIELMICNRNYKIACEEEQYEPIKNAAGYLNAKIHDLRVLHPYIENERVAVLAALEIAQEVLDLQNKVQEQSQIKKLMQKMSIDIARQLEYSGNLQEDEEFELVSE